MKFDFETLRGIKFGELSAPQEDQVLSVLDLLRVDMEPEAQRDLGFLAELYLAESMKGKKANKEAMQKIETIAISANTFARRIGFNNDTGPIMKNEKSAIHKFAMKLKEMESLDGAPKQSTRQDKKYSDELKSLLARTKGASLEEFKKLVHKIYSSLDSDFSPKVAHEEKINVIQVLLDYGTFGVGKMGFDSRIDAKDLEFKKFLVDELFRIGDPEYTARVLLNNIPDTRLAEHIFAHVLSDKNFSEIKKIVFLSTDGMESRHQEVRFKAIEILAELGRTDLLIILHKSVKDERTAMFIGEKLREIGTLDKYLNDPETEWHAFCKKLDSKL